jgi:ADP-ribose pyrophosphatase YjhB (NUDIX family)
MSQKYKFFITENCLILSQNEAVKPSKSPSNLSDNDKAIYSELARIFSACNLEENQTFIVDNPDMIVERLCSNFTLIKAAGGLVENNDDDVLLIYRDDMWDLPKGKLENFETIEEGAKREVEEECGVSNLQIVSEAFTSFHLYQMKGETCIKLTYWFRMKTKSVESLVPQTEEGITQVIWANKVNVIELNQPMYASIKQVIQHYS